MKIAVVGAGSFIARTLAMHPASADWRYLGHGEALAAEAGLDEVDMVINCALDPRLKKQSYEPGLDVDLRLAQRLAARTEVRYVMLGTRMSYGPAGPGGRLVETDAARPLHPYGCARLETERRLGELLGERLTVLRLSNIFGYEDVPGRSSFFAIALRSLREHGRIVLDMSPFVERDFLSVDTLAGWLARIAERPAGGVYNLGAGFGTPTGRIAQWLIEGFGAGELRVTDLREYDAFWLDVGKAVAAFGIDLPEPEAVREQCRALGRRLRQELKR
ncbi:MAG: NAD(P)-dependent oxidoreductase [Rhodocyclaceae bacterium]|nr:NAD(P)-dependent oxidoreductase [Rhodocyclaceae bacterium]